METIKMTLAMVETSHQKGELQITMAGGEEIIKIKEVMKINKTSPYYTLCKMSNHNTNDCRYKCKKCTWHTHQIQDC